MKTIILKETATAYGNLLWGDITEENKQNLYTLMQDKFGYVSRFPEGDGLAFSKEVSCKRLTILEEKETFEFLVDLLSQVGIPAEKIETNLCSFFINSQLN